MPSFLAHPAIPELAYAGDRPDAPPLEQRGNATFMFAKFDDEGKFLVTVPFMGPAGGLIAWDAQTGAMLSRLDIKIPMMLSWPVWMIDGTRGRMLGQNSSLYDDKFRLVDLRTGRIVGDLPDENTDTKHPTMAAGLVGDGNEVLLFKPGRLEVWQLDPPQLARSIPSPMPVDRYVPGCVGGIPATYNDKHCFEFSPDRRTLAVAYTPVFSPMSESHFIVIDLPTLEVKELRMPNERANRTLASFAFSPDNKWLAVGTDREMLIYDRADYSWANTIPGDHKRNQLVGPVRFTPDSKRVITLEDQLQASVYDADSGKLIGRHKPEFENWEGVFEVSRDGSRVVIYKFLSDTFEVMDGQDMKRLGFVCPYFCNVKHNPIQPPYAVSPDGRHVAISHRRGTAIWDTATDQIRFPLRDPDRKPLPYPYQQ